MLFLIESYLIEFFYIVSSKRSFRSHWIKAKIYRRHSGPFVEETCFSGGRNMDRNDAYHALRKWNTRILEF